MDGAIKKHKMLTLLISLLLGLSWVSRQGYADARKDRQECAPQLVGLATCLPYVANKGKAPTPDCCSGLKQVLDHDKKCLCVIVRDRNDPDVGLQINVTLALALPALCHASANVSKCPELLQMDPNSSEAQVFYQQSKNSSSVDSMSSASSPASSSGQGISVSPSSGTAVVAQGPTSSGSGRRCYCKAPSLRLDIAASFIFSSVLVSCFSSLL